MRINFDLGELAAFVAVAERMSFRAASEALFISPSALSRRIDRIEEALGVRLFDRTTRRVSLTEDGEQFLVHAGEALASLQNAIADVGDRAERRAGLVTVACIPSVANHLLPAVLARFAALHPDTRIKMLDHSAPMVLKAVVEKQADFGVNFLGAQEPSIDFAAIVKERYVLAVPARHPLAALRSIGWEEFVGERFISLAADSGNRMLLDNAVAQAKARPATHVEVNHVEGALALVRAGLGVSAIPRLALAGTASKELVGVPLTRPQVSRTLGLITRKGHRLSARAEVLARLLVQALKQAGVVQEAAPPVGRKRASA
ncbi:LysR family transcriptional regulator [Mitsuaria sp. GD03876]|uniref:LysR family transcriptional regulator n=1 Tax=Mitsuaria sp. GD03876 TaxID=2975399 RepID=UPI00244B1F1F|nr:LysR family transcriptional regulator [Mitsuaria sp. GD03876]MDH0866167.1 LysR substrate-binding domain-containing protein [Mitsuaria sp. GD03876]